MKTDLWHKFLKFLDYERGKVVGVLMGIGIVVFVYGCGLEIRSPFTGKKVDRASFNVEVMNLDTDLSAEKVRIENQLALYNEAVNTRNAKTELGESEFKVQEEIRATFIEKVGGIAMAFASGTITPGAGIAAAVQLSTILGLGGAAVDSFRKNKKIAEAKT